MAPVNPELSNNFTFFILLFIHSFLLYLFPFWSLLCLFGFQFRGPIFYSSSAVSILYKKKKGQHWGDFPKRRVRCERPLSEKWNMERNTLLKSLTGTWLLLEKKYILQNMGPYCQDYRRELHKCCGNVAPSVLSLCSVFNLRGMEPSLWTSWQHRLHLHTRF